jgi:ATP/ADP translocase
MLGLISSEFLEILINGFLSVLLLMILSISARFLLVLSGQNWVKTFSHTATLTILPIITFVITKVISGNIALSLGMVGALSIVRFRHPVKSPFELAVYFASITMGIAASVSLPWLIFFAISITVAILFLVTLDFLSKFFLKESMYQTSFSEGNQLSTLEVSLESSNQILASSPYLISASRTAGTHTYILASSDFQALKDISMEIESDSSIDSLQLHT